MDQDKSPITDPSVRISDLIDLYIKQLPDCVRMAELGDFKPLKRCVAELSAMSGRGHKQEGTNG
jgi:hypothetical protein